MGKQIAYKEIYDPLFHYSRGVLFFDKKKFTFVAYRMPYLDLDNKTWKTEKEFEADYRRMVNRKYVTFHQIP